jgi:tetratricopeptide (TPR) repeat protein
MQTPPQDLFATAIAHLQAGRFAQAEPVCEQLVGDVPDSADAALLLGVARYQLGKFAAAETAFLGALRLRPDFLDAHLNLGSTLLALGRLDQAAESYRAAIRLDPGARNAHYSLGNVLLRLDRPFETIDSFRTAIALDPDFAEAHLGLGAALRLIGNLHEAAEALRNAVRSRPAAPEPHYHLAGVLHDSGELDAAEDAYRTALGLNPDFAAAQNELGTVLRDRGRPAEAIAHFREAIRLRPDFAEAHNNMGAARNDLGHLPVAIDSYRQALRCNPGSADAHFNLGCALLLAGQAAEGWAEYEWCWRTPQMAGQERSFAMPRWQGEKLRGRTILLHAEQGLGDTLQFCRFASVVAAGAEVVLQVQPDLVRLLSALPGMHRVLPRGVELPHCDVHCPLMSLPYVFGGRLPDHSSQIPYLRPDPSLVEAWRRRLADLQGLRVGLVWAAGQKRDLQQRHAADRRSIALELLDPLADIAGVSFVSLQKELPSGHRHGGRLATAMHDITSELSDFADTAAAVRNLDLVITVDTAAAHLCGAIGAPAWVLNKFDSDWRWPRDRDDTPWYPTLRQFRQRRGGDWPRVIEQVADALRRLVAGDYNQLRPRGVRLCPADALYAAISSPHST